MSLGLAIVSCALAAGACHPSGAPGTQAVAVRVDAPAGSTVELRALDVPRGWIASFCTARTCTPGHTSLRLRSGAAAVGVSYIPGGANAAPLRALHLAATAAGARADAREVLR